MAWPELEKLVRQVGLRNVVYALAGVCNDKAAVHTTEQDYNAARIWERDYEKLISAADSLHSIE